MYLIEDQIYNFSSYKIKLADPNQQYYLLLYEDRNKYQTLVNIITYDKNFNHWVCIYAKLLENYIGIKYYNEAWNLTGSKVLVLYSVGIGSGGFISYTVLGEENGAILEYISEKDIFGGSIFFDGTKLIRGTGNQFRVWEKKNGEFILAPYEMPQYLGAFIIRYSILDENTVRVDNTVYSLPVGSIVQFIREDFNDITERILFTNNASCLKYLQIATFKIECPVKITATIIPSGYNWDGAVDITINAI